MCEGDEHKEPGDGAGRFNLWYFFRLTLHSSDESFYFCNELKNGVVSRTVFVHTKKRTSQVDRTYPRRPLALFVFRIALQGCSLTVWVWLCPFGYYWGVLLNQLRSAWGADHYELMRVELFRRINALSLQRFRYLSTPDASGVLALTSKHDEFYWYSYLYSFSFLHKKYARVKKGTSYILTGMCSLVDFEVFWSREHLAASRERAVKGLLSGVHAYMVH